MATGRTETIDELIHRMSTRVTNADTWYRDDRVSLPVFASDLKRLVDAARRWRDLEKTIEQKEGSE